jgi:DNA helicase-2/ATP-dependent DNA helicase PcrA
MTVHAAKGLEFDLVFVPGLEDGVFPSARSVEERNGEEEERRLLYVAITRAKKELILSYAKTRFVFGDYQASIPSRFVKELPVGEIDFEEVYFGSTQSSGKSYKNTCYNITSTSEGGMFGKRVFHQKFGYGKVVGVDGSKLEINFEKSGKKIVMKEFVEY